MTWGIFSTVNGEHHTLLAASCLDKGNVGVADMLASASFYVVLSKKPCAFFTLAEFSVFVEHGSE